MSTGNIVEIIGAVVDVEFPRESVPKVYEALTVSDTGLTLEVQQQLGDGVVRTIAMGSSDGLKPPLQRPLLKAWVNASTVPQPTCATFSSPPKPMRWWRRS